MSNFITTADLSDYIGRDIDYDGAAMVAVDAACDIVRTIADQDFVGGSATVSVKLDGSGTDTVFLPNRPVVNAGTVEVNGETVTDYVCTASGRLIRTSNEASDYAVWPGGIWPEGRQNVSVDYEYGYGGTVPADVRMVALMIAYRLVTQGGAISEQVGDVRKSYAVAATDLTKGEQAILHRYRR